MTSHAIPQHLSRPRLRPGTPLLRRPGAVQLGIDSVDAVVLAPAGRALERWLRLVDGSRGLSELARSAARLGLPWPELRALLDRLAAVGLVEEADERSDRTGFVRLIGAGRIGRAIARLLVTADIVRLDLVDDDPVDRTIYPRHPGLGRQASALQAELADAIGDRRQAPAITVGAAPETASPNVTLVASDRLDVDRTLADALLRADQPHLLVRATGDGTVVGPLVLPGSTACVRCTDLVRCDADADWPALLAQLCRTTGSPTDALIGWAAATAVVQILALLSSLSSPDPSWPETSGATIELGPDCRPRRRRWPQHPACGCNWTGGAVTSPLNAWEDGPRLAAS